MAAEMDLTRLETLLETMEPAEIRANYADELADSPRCEALLQQFEAMDDDLAALKDSEPPPALKPPLSLAGVTSAPDITEDNTSAALYRLPVPDPKPKRFHLAAWAVPLAAAVVFGILWVANLDSRINSISSDMQPISEEDRASLAEPVAIDSETGEMVSLERSEEITESEPVLEKQVASQPPAAEKKDQGTFQTFPAGKEEKPSESRSGYADIATKPGLVPGKQNNSAKRKASPSKPIASPPNRQDLDNASLESIDDAVALNEPIGETVPNLEQGRLRAQSNLPEPNVSYDATNQSSDVNRYSSNAGFVEDFEQSAQAPALESPNAGGALTDIPTPNWDLNQAILYEANGATTEQTAWLANFMDAWNRVDSDFPNSLFVVGGRYHLPPLTRSPAFVQDLRRVWAEGTRPTILNTTIVAVDKDVLRVRFEMNSITRVLALSIKGGRCTEAQVISTGNQPKK